MVAIPEFDYTQASKAITALKEYASRESNDDLLGSSDRGVWMQIKLAKMTSGYKQRHEFICPHCILPEDAEVCLLVIDGAKEFQQKIDELKIGRKFTVLTAKSFREKYSRFEAKRQVARQFGLFLVDASLANKINSLFGESFKKANKSPSIINVSQDKKILGDEQLKENINNALNGTILNKTASDLKNAKFGRVEMSEKDLMDNFKVVFESWKKAIDWKFVQSVSILSDNSVVLPIYACVPGVWLLDDQVMEEAAPEVTPKQEESLKKAAKKTNKNTKKAVVVEEEKEEKTAPAKKSNKKSKAAPAKKDEDAALKVKTDKSIAKKPAAKGKKAKAAK
ncbi:ribosomal protein L1p/L10e family-domain-containing protein [Absidia repens]|uniref:Ribosomal protein L1p/L10e family-domain-containing protein n=1 Tax=Absidia repens TaxID=90262 RepID=A0A1X2HXA4_9FUNG|nr:ribosomal protein L1p/L10e family-domain-containing protein [Absidia repens]